MHSSRRSRRGEQQQTREFSTSASGAVEVVLRFAAADEKTNRGAGIHAKADRVASEHKTEQCIALIDYHALDDDEISFRAGDVINVTGKGTASGFWEGYVATPVSPALATAELSDAEHSSSLSHSPSASLLSPQPQQRCTRGLFPNCLVTSNMRLKHSLSHYALQNVALCLYAYQATGDGEMSFVHGDVITAVRPSSSPGWWYGVKSGGPAWVAPGTAASNRFVDPAAATDFSESRAVRKTQATMDAALQGGTTAPAGDGKGEERLFPTNFVTCDVVQANFSFAGRQPHELSCKVGDIIQVHRRWNDGWWEGSLRGRRGIFPSNYTIPNITTTAPPLFCARCRTVYASSMFYSTCATCMAEERVEDAMMQAVEAYVRGEATELDLFANVDIGLHTPSEASSVNDGEVSVDGALRQSSREASHDDSRNLTRGLSVVIPSTCNDGGTSRRRQCRRSGSRPSEARVSLLTEKDMADLASNRVKLME
ncbi:Variant SH3 domain family protein [Leishmania donovani]|uniref:Variant SH3 domain family protein n=1 Tax=Leishmania donovani TaxID=5661 RepID=A0A504XBN2_LEIDO|nr:Variant SH3 domain family protein [Leishmania donovani]